MSWLGRIKFKRNKYRNKDLSYLIGVLLGDGFVTEPSKRGNYRVGLQTVSKEFAQRFKKTLANIGLHPCSYLIEKSKENPKWQNQYVIEATSKRFVNWYKKLALDDIKKWVLRKEFIEGFYESEGSLQHRTKNCWRIQIYNSCLNKIKLISDFLANRKFKTSVYSTKRKNKQREYDLTILGGQVETERFFKIFHPTIKNLKLSLG